MERSRPIAYKNWSISPVTHHSGMTNSKKTNKYLKSNNFSKKPSFFATPSAGLRLELERRDREGSGDPGGVGEGDLPGPGIVDVDVGDGDPDEELLALDPSKSPHAVLLHEARDLRVVRHRAPNRSEPVLLLALLLQPDEPGGAVVAHLHYLV
jgi:hypothetical protein